MKGNRVENLGDQRVGNQGGRMNAQLAGGRVATVNSKEAY